MAYEDQRSTVLAVDNMNGCNLAGRTLRVDHAGRYRKPRKTTPKQDETKSKNPNTNQNSSGIKIEHYDSDSEDENEYEERRRLIWDYEAYDAYEMAKIGIYQPKEASAPDDVLTQDISSHMSKLDDDDFESFLKTTSSSFFEDDVLSTQLRSKTNKVKTQRSDKKHSEKSKDDIPSSSRNRKNRDDEYEKDRERQSRRDSQSERRDRSRSRDYHRRSYHTRG